MPSIARNGALAKCDAGWLSSFHIRQRYVLNRASIAVAAAGTQPIPQSLLFRGTGLAQGTEATALGAEKIYMRCKTSAVMDF